jgi:uncharacterized membrane protein YeaQ/YmgE (transglycosylase-associated protein family)
MRDGVELIRFLLVGLVSGWIAAILVRGSVRVRGCLTYMVIGMVGAVIGGYVFRALGISDVATVFTATAGAVMLLVIIRLLRSS